MTCIVPGCPHPMPKLERGRFCSRHWFALPIEMRRRWWEETDYGEKPPSDELRKAVLDALGAKAEIDILQSPSPSRTAGPPSGVGLSE